MAKKLRGSKTSTTFLHQHRRRHLLLFLSLLSFFHIFPHSLADIHFQELETAVDALRSRGYNLFGNSIVVSDLLYQVLSGDNFTLLSPPDSALFSLDMSTDAVHYVHSLRSHLLPRRLSLSDLRSIALSPSPYVETLVPQHLVFVANRRTDLRFGVDDTAAAELEYITVEGVRISNPDAYLGPHLAVHGLDAVLSTAVSPPPGATHGGGIWFAPPLRSDPSTSGSQFESAGGAPQSIEIQPVSMSPGTVGGDARVLPPSSVHRDSRPLPPPPTGTAAAPSPSGVPPALTPTESRQITPQSTVSPPPALERVAPKAPSPVINLSSYSPPFVLDSILPEIPENSTPPAEPLEVSNRPKKLEYSQDHSKQKGQEDEHEADGNPVPKGVAGTSPHRFEPPDVIRPEVGPPPPVGLLPEPGIAEARNSWTELIRDYAGAPAQSAGAFGRKRSSMGMEGDSKHGGLGRIEDDYGYAGEDFVPEDLTTLFHT